MTTMDALAVLFDSSVSAWSRLLSEIVLVCWPTAVAVATTVSVAVCPEVRVPTVHKPVAGSKLGDGVADKRDGVGSIRSRSTTLVAVLGPPFLAVIVNVTSWPSGTASIGAPLLAVTVFV